ncbi:MAG TPA: hypothetical protein PKY99_15190, partial [Turneriella sp.]|nr:hypothetical protein [Turneriella sp.]
VNIHAAATAIRQRNAAKTARTTNAKKPVSQVIAKKVTANRKNLPDKIGCVTISFAQQLSSLTGC